MSGPGKVQRAERGVGKSITPSRRGVTMSFEFGFGFGFNLDFEREFLFFKF